MKKTRHIRKRGGTKDTNNKKTQKSSYTVEKLKPKEQFTLMTFNVESWLNMISPASTDAETQALKNAFTQFIENPVSSEYPNWKNLKDLFRNVDILCIQEDALLGEPGADEETYRSADEKQENFIKNIGDLHLVASCKSHPYRWPKTKGLYYPGSKISNTIYSKYDAIPNLSIPAQLTTDLQTIHSDGKYHPRCWAVSNLKIPVQSTTRRETVFNIIKKPVSVKVATIHLSGGRFDDIASLSGNNYIIKIRQIIKLISREKPDIICGDFNTKLVQPTVDNYFKSLDIKEDINEITDRIPESEFADFYVSIYNHIIHNTFLKNISILDKWKIWMYGLDYVFKDPRLAELIGIVPFKSVFDNGSAKDTTIFGGTVDNIYYNPRRLNCVSNTVVDGVIVPGQRILSDHAPVKATFYLK
jgi:endonuclease/exonuclease/phosphatase family metal-dependent hydrolase